MFFSKGSKTNGNTSTTSPEITNTSNRQPRQIGNGWWESYDPASGHMFYSHTEGITQWEWPKEVPKASRTKTSQVLESAQKKLNKGIITLEEYTQIVNAQKIHDAMEAASNATSIASTSTTSTTSTSSC